MKTNKNIRSRDKINGFVSVSVIFLFCAVGILYIFLNDTDINLLHYKDTIIKKTERQRSFRSVQSNRLGEYEALQARIAQFDPSINAVYEENDIKFLINELKLSYEQNMWDTRYQVFYHAALFFEMWLSDKKIAWSKTQNIAQFKKNLEDCEIGLKKKSDLLKR